MVGVPAPASVSTLNAHLPVTSTLPACPANADTAASAATANVITRTALDVIPAPSATKTRDTKTRNTKTRKRETTKKMKTRRDENTKKTKTRKRTKRRKEHAVSGSS